MDGINECEGKSPIADLLAALDTPGRHREDLKVALSDLAAQLFAIEDLFGRPATIMASDALSQARIAARDLAKATDCTVEQLLGDLSEERRARAEAEAASVRWWRATGDLLRELERRQAKAGRGMPAGFDDLDRWWRINPPATACRLCADLGRVCAVCEGGVR